jgi:hypothetical protein
MRKKRLFEYVVLWHPNEAQTKEGKQTEIIVSKQEVLAVDDKTAAISANRQIPEEYIDSLDQVEVIVRPF